VGPIWAGLAQKKPEEPAEGSNQTIGLSVSIEQIGRKKHYFGSREGKTAGLAFQQRGKENWSD